MKRANVRATWSNVLWLSLRTITRHEPPRPLPGVPTRGFSTVWLTSPQDRARGAAVQLVHERRSVPSPARARRALDDAHLRRPLDRDGVQRALSAQPREGPDGA